MTDADSRQNFINDLWAYFYQSFGLSRSQVTFPRHPKNILQWYLDLFIVPRDDSFSGWKPRNRRVNPGIADMISTERG
jgi:hypothetical protein